MPTAPPKQMLLPKTPPAMPPPAATTHHAVKAVATPLFETGAVAWRAPIVVLYGPEKVGKTSTVAFAPNTAIIQAERETGYETLLSAKLVPDIPRLTCDSWRSLLSIVDSLIVECPYQMIVLDAIGGFERFCHEEVCRRDFNGDWTEKGFLSYNQGFELSATEWICLLSKLERLRNAHNVNICLISHAHVKTFKDPLGKDFDRWIPECHAKTWGQTAKFADAILFLNFLSVEAKGKGVAGTTRVCYTQSRDAFVAGNRFGMPPVLNIPNDPSQAWAIIDQAMKGQK